MLKFTQVVQPAGMQNNMGLDLLMNMLGGLGGGGLAHPSAPDGKPHSNER